MPVSTATLTPTLVASLKGAGVAGVSGPNLAISIANAMTQFLPSVSVTTQHVGVLGAGTGTGKVFLEPSSGISILASSLTGQGLTGVSNPQLASGIISGLTQEFNALATCQVVITGTSTGTGVATLVNPISSLLTSFLISNFKANGLAGASSESLAIAIGNGVSTWLRTAVITTIDVGTPVFPFSASTGVGVGIIA
jgi:hypothetical protein